MKRMVQIFLLEVFLLFACQIDKSEIQNKQQQDYYQFHRLDLRKSEIDAEIMIPDATAGIGASFKPQIIHELADYKWIIHIGRNFELHIEDFGDNSYRYPEVRKKIMTNKIFKVQILKEEENQILFKRNIDNTYHVYSVKKIGDVYYELSGREEGDSKKVAEFMYRSIKSFKKK